MNGNIIWKILLILQPFAGTFIVNALGGNLSEKNRLWYSKLKQSPLTPPPIVFPIAWTILYLLIGLSAMFYLEHPTFLTQYFGPYEVQLLLNFLWSVIFFKLQKPLIALIINFIMIGLTAYLLWLSWKNSQISFWLLVPYALWITFAFYLNFYIVIKSKTR